VGCPLTLVGHGLVTRQVLGPQRVHGPPERLEITVRRYRCRACGAVVMVGPRGLLWGRSYGGSAVALALAHYAAGWTTAAIRAATSPARLVGVAAVDRWVTVERWARAARRVGLLGARPITAATDRLAAERLVLILAGRAGWKLGDDLATRAFEGAAIAA
jgi:hypothetical protein